MAKVQLLHRLRLVPGPAPIVATPAPTAKPIAPVQDADRRTLSFPRGPARGARFTADYVREIALFAFFWVCPLVNVFNRYIAFKRVRRPILVGGIARHAARLYRLEASLHHLPQPGPSSMVSAFSISRASL
jgi:hypothetical protein